MPGVGVPVGRGSAVTLTDQSRTRDANATAIHQSRVHQTRHRRAAASDVCEYVGGGVREDGRSTGADGGQTYQRPHNIQSDAVSLTTATLDRLKEADAFQ